MSLRRLGQDVREMRDHRCRDKGIQGGRATGEGLDELAQQHPDLVRRSAGIRADAPATFDLPTGAAGSEDRFRVPDVGD